MCIICNMYICQYYMYRLVYVLAYCIVYLSCIFSKVIICLLCVNYVHRTCTECTSWFVMLYYVVFGRRLVVRISVPSVTLCHSVHLTNKRLVTCNLCDHWLLD